MADGAFVTLTLKPDALSDDCERAALGVTARQAPPACASPVIGPDRLRRQGAMVLLKTRDGFAVDAVKPQGAARRGAVEMVRARPIASRAPRPREAWMQRHRKPTCRRRSKAAISCAFQKIASLLA